MTHASNCYVADADAPADEQAHPPRRVVLELRECSAHVRAGYGLAAIAVRTLDNISLAVHQRELVLLRGGVASGARALVRALDGRLKICDGSRRAVPNVQLRRASVSAIALQGMVDGWREPVAYDVADAVTSPVVYLFRVRSTPASPSGDGDHRDRAAWRLWARALRARGGSIVAQIDHVSEAMPTAARHDEQPVWRPNAKTPAVHDASAGVSRVSETTGASAGIRVCTLVAGRLISADPAMRRTSWSDSNAPERPLACRPAPTAWPAPSPCAADGSATVPRSPATTARSALPASSTPAP